MTWVTNTNIKQGVSTADRTRACVIAVTVLRGKI
jgi:hypothetical protein